jgi:flagellin-like hook-associated protein FlgL
MIQTAEGGVQVISDLLQRMRELAIQALNGTNSDTQREFLDLEFQELREQISNVTESTVWNGFSLLNGEAGKPIGERSLYRVTSTPRQFSKNVEILGLQAGDLVINGLLVGDTKLEDDLLSPTANAKSSAIATVAAINRITGPLGNARGQIQAIAFNSDWRSSSIVIADVSVDLTDWLGDPEGAASAIASALQASEKFGLHSGRHVEYLSDTAEIRITFREDESIAEPIQVTGAFTSEDVTVRQIRPYQPATTGSGVYAKVNPNIFSGVPIGHIPGVTGRIGINGFFTKTLVSHPNDTQKTRSDVVAAINDVARHTGVQAFDSGSDLGGVRLIAADGRNIEIKFDTADNTSRFGAAFGLKECVQIGTYSLESDLDRPIVISSSPVGDIRRVGLTAGSYGGDQSVMSTRPRELTPPVEKQMDGVTFTDDVSEGDRYTLTINGESLVVVATADSTHKAIRDNFISLINEQTHLNVVALAGRSLDELLIQSVNSRKGFTLAATKNGTINSLLNLEKIQIHQDSLNRMLTNNDLLINNIGIPASDSTNDPFSSENPAHSSDSSASAISLAAAVNSQTTKTGVIAQPLGAFIKGLVVDTSGPSGSQLTKEVLYINGHAIEVEFIRNEREDVRLEKVLSAVNQKTYLHGVYAQRSDHGLTLESDGRNLSVWFDADRPGLSAASFGLGSPDAITQVAQLNFEPVAERYPLVRATTDYVEFYDGGKSTESLSLRTGAPATESGVISFQDGVMYRGNGSQAVVVGRVDSEKNGLNGQPLRVNYVTEFVNGGLEGSLSVSGTTASMEGWKVYNSQVRLDGMSTITGWPTPSDASDPYGAPLTDTSTLANTFNGSIVKRSTNPSPSGGSYLQMGTSGITVTQGYGVIHGPYLVNDEPVDIPAGSSVQFDWRATGGGDAFDVYAYLLNVDTGETIELLNQTGASAGASTSWATQTVEVPKTGRYKFIFVSGTWDASGGRALGANLQVDGIKVNASRPPVFTDTQVAEMRAFVDYVNTAPESRMFVEINGVRVESDLAGSLAHLKESLLTNILDKISAGQLTNISASMVSGSIQFESTVAGTGFSLRGVDYSGNHLVNSFINELRPNGYGSNGVTAIRGATAQSQSAMTAYGMIRLVSESSMPTKIEYGSDGFGPASNFISLGFSEGEFGGLSKIAKPTATRMTFQVGAGNGQEISVELANLGSGEFFASKLSPQHLQLKIGSLSLIEHSLIEIDSASDRIAETRASLGACMNRLEHIISNVSNTRMNLEVSQSRIEDVDYGDTSTALARSQILQEASTAVLAQANLSQQDVLKLLEI